MHLWCPSQINVCYSAYCSLSPWQHYTFFLHSENDGKVSKYIHSIRKRKACFTQPHTFSKVLSLRCPINMVVMSPLSCGVGTTCGHTRAKKTNNCIFLNKSCPRTYIVPLTCQMMVFSYGFTCITLSGYTTLLFPTTNKQQLCTKNNKCSFIIFASW